MKLYNVNNNEKFIQYSEQDFSKGNREEIIETWFEKNPDCILENEKVLLIGRQVQTNLGSIIDLVGLDKEGNLVIIELKRDRTPRETLAQILEYASFVKDISYDHLEEMFKEYTGEENIILTDYHRNYFSLQVDEGVAFNKNQKLVIVGQIITPDIKQTSLYLREKGIDVFCLEFKYFETKSKEKIISSEFVIGKDSEVVNRVSSRSLPKINKETFFQTVDQFGKDFYNQLFNFAEKNNLYIQWGNIGFSLNVVINDVYVILLWGFPPPSVYKQTIRTVFSKMVKKINNPEIIVDYYRNELIAFGGFESAGSELKLQITKDIIKEKQEKLHEIILKVAIKINENGLLE